jgi:uncharacterized protein YbcI
MLRRVALVRINVSEKHIASIIRVTRNGVLGTTLADIIASFVPTSPIIINLMMGAISSSETLVLTRAPRRNIPEGDIVVCSL